MPSRIARRQATDTAYTALLGQSLLANASCHAAAVPAAAASAVSALRSGRTAPVAVRGQRRAPPLLKGGGAGLQPVHKAEPLLHLAGGVQTCTGQQFVIEQACCSDSCHY